jgi:uncharacterized membrane protein YtjA (UPF0391 family)
LAASPAVTVGLMTVHSNLRAGCVRMNGTGIAQELVLYERTFKKEILYMLRAAIGFFVIGLLAVLLGANNIAGISIELGKTLLTVFLVLAVITFVASLITGRNPKSLV